MYMTYVCIHAYCLLVLLLLSLLLLVVVVVLVLLLVVVVVVVVSVSLSLSSLLSSCHRPECARNAPSEGLAAVFVKIIIEEI